MKTYQINIARAYTLSDWKGDPAHNFYARVHLDDTFGEDDALGELKRLEQVYPFPMYHLTLHQSETITQSETVASTAPAAFLESKLWSYPSIHTEDVSPQATT